MGGSVAVESVVGQGTSFNLTFKVQCDPKNSSEVEDPEEPEKKKWMSIVSS